LTDENDNASLKKRICRIPFKEAIDILIPMVAIVTQNIVKIENLIYMEQFFFFE